MAHVGDLGKLASLESYDADWNAADYTGRSVAHCSLSILYLCAISSVSIISIYTGRTALHTAATTGNLDVVRLMENKCI